MALIDNLISYWKLDETAGNAIDAHDANDGVVTGATRNVGGKINTAFSFDGNDHVTKATPSNMDLTTGMTLNAWVKVTTNNAYATVMAKTGVYGGGQAHLWILGFNNLTMKMNLYASTINTTYANCANTTLATGTWYMVTVTYDGTTIRYYLNGSPDGTVNAPGSLDVNLNNFQLAGRYDGYYWKGIIDEPGVWSRALTADEITELYNAGAGLPYPLGEAAGTNMQIQIGGVWKVVESIQQNVGGAWKAVAGAQLDVGSVWKAVF